MRQRTFFFDRLPAPYFQLPLIFCWKTQYASIAIVTLLILFQVSPPFIFRSQNYKHQVFQSYVDYLHFFRTLFLVDRVRLPQRTDIASCINNISSHLTAGKVIIFGVQLLKLVVAEYSIYEQPDFIRFNDPVFYRAYHSPQSSNWQCQNITHSVQSHFTDLDWFLSTCLDDLAEDHGPYTSLNEGGYVVSVRDKSKRACVPLYKRSMSVKIELMKVDKTEITRLKNHPRNYVHPTSHSHWSCHSRGLNCNELETAITSDHMRGTIVTIANSSDAARVIMQNSNRPGITVVTEVSNGLSKIFKENLHLSPTTLQPAVKELEKRVLGISLMMELSGCFLTDHVVRTEENVKVAHLKINLLFIFFVFLAELFIAHSDGIFIRLRRHRCFCAYLCQSEIAFLLQSHGIDSIF